MLSQYFLSYSLWKKKLPITTHKSASHSLARRVTRKGKKSKGTLIKIGYLIKRLKLTLKAVFATFLLVCFLCLKENTCETRKNIFHYFSEALFVLEKIKV